MQPRERWCLVQGALRPLTARQGGSLARRGPGDGLLMVFAFYVCARATGQGRGERSTAPPSYVTPPPQRKTNCPARTQGGREEGRPSAGAGRGRVFPVGAPRTTPAAEAPLFSFLRPVRVSHVMTPPFRGHPDSPGAVRSVPAHPAVPRPASRSRSWPRFLSSSEQQSAGLWVWASFGLRVASLCGWEPGGRRETPPGRTSKQRVCCPGAVSAAPGPRAARLTQTCCFQPQRRSRDFGFFLNYRPLPRGLPGRGHGRLS